MKVTLATEYEGHKPDTTIEVSDAEGKRLIGVGRARAVAGKGTKAEQEAAEVAEQVAQKSREAADAVTPAVTTEVATDATVTRG